MDYRLVWIRNTIIGSLILFFSYQYMVFATQRHAYTNPSYATCAALTQICIVWIMLFALASFLTKRLPRWIRIVKKDLLFFFIFFFISGPLMAVWIPFMQHTTWIYHNRKASPRAQDLLAQDLPRLVPDDDALRTLWVGSQDGQIEWEPWMSWQHGVPPALAWGVFIGLLLLISFSVILIFTKRWLEDEQLAFPLAHMSEMLVEGQKNASFGEEERVPLLRTKVFWIGFSATLIFQLCTYLSPGLEWRLGAFNIPDTTPIFGVLDYHSRQFWWRPVFTAMLFMCPRQILGSTLFFHLLQCTFMIIGCEYGYQGYTGSQLQGASAFPFKQDQLLGGSVALACIMVFLSRNYLKQQFLDCLRWIRIRGEDNNHEQQKSNSPAMFVFLLSALGFVIWTLVIGFSMKTSLLFLACILLAIIVNTRGRAEIGMPSIIIFGNFHPLGFVSLVGTKLIGLKTIAASYVHGWLFYDNYLLHLSPALMDSLKIGHLLKSSYQWVLSVAAAAVVAGLLIGGYVSTSTTYDLGLAFCNGGDPPWMCQRAWWMMRPDIGFNSLHSGYAVAGGCIVTALWYLHGAFAGFSPHPMGYLLSLNPGMGHYSLSIIIAYAVKSLSIHYGSIRAYLLLVPFFIGLLFGQITGGALVGLLNVIFDTNVYVPMI